MPAALQSTDRGTESAYDQPMLIQRIIAPIRHPLLPYSRPIRVRLRRLALLWALLGLFSACETAFHPAQYPKDSLPQPIEPVSADYQSKVQKVFDRRCVVCHSCFTAPCQLNLSAFEGADRGANRKEVYDPSRLKAVHPTRLFEDARSTTEWQKKLGFFPVSSEVMMGQFLAHKAAFPTAYAPYDKEATHVCPKDSTEVTDLLKDHPEKGMPMGFPQLDPTDQRTLLGWLHEGAPGPTEAVRKKLEAPSNGAQGEAILKKWETFLNQPDNKTRLSSRYIYEHLFMAHVYFDSIPGDFYRLVRSRGLAPDPVNEITTVRPYDSPETDRFEYRFQKVTSTIVRKNHMPYRLNDAKMKRFRELFLDPNWNVAVLPSYDSEIAANPFIAFKEIPARSRYQFLLDDAYYHVMTFIYGPVCKGNVALNVIQTHFNILFLKPDADPTVNDPEFLKQAGDDLRLPADGESKFAEVFDAYKSHQESYQKRCQALYARLVHPGRELSDLWDGDGVNDNAVLTVYRHYDSADLSTGAVGGIPKTAWVMDYPIFERIYYDLVAGFNVYGNVTHQLATRRYMDNLRTESEDLFLSFLPSSARAPLRDSWYRGKLSKEDQDKRDPFYKSLPETRIHFKAAAPEKIKAEFLKLALFERMNTKVRGTTDSINGPVAKGRLALNSLLHKITNQPAPYVQVLPEVTFVRFRGAQGAEDLPYTIFRNQQFLNVSFMFLDQTYREPAADALHVMPRLLGSYPNFFFDVPAGKAQAFVKELQSTRPGDDSFKKLVDHYGVRRMSPRFWETSDWFMGAVPAGSGVLDLSRYENY